MFPLKPDLVPFCLVRMVIETESMLCQTKMTRAELNEADYKQRSEKEGISVLVNFCRLILLVTLTDDC